MDSVLEDERVKEDEVKKQTSEQLDAFKQRQQEAEHPAHQEDASNAQETVEAWTTGARKRKKGRESTIGGVKLRRTSTTEKPSKPSATDISGASKRPTEDSLADNTKIQKDSEPIVKPTESNPSSKSTKSDSASKSQSPPITAPALSLVAYSSDEDE